MPTSLDHQERTLPLTDTIFVILALGPPEGMSRQEIRDAMKQWNETGAPPIHPSHLVSDAGIAVRAAITKAQAPSGEAT